MKTTNNTNLTPQLNDALKKAFEKVITLVGEQQASRELGFAINIIAKNKSLQTCSIESVIDAVVSASRIRLSLNPSLRLASLSARENEAVLDITYMGLISVLKKSGGCKYIEATIVYSDEDFEYSPAEGLLKHIPFFATSAKEQEKRKIIGCYSRATLPTNDVVFCFMPMWEIEKVRNQSKKSGEHYWTEWQEEMIKKTVIRRHFKLLVNGSELDEVISALEVENTNHAVQPIDKKKSSLFDLDFE